VVDRSIAVRLSLQDNYSAGIRRAGQATQDFARQGEQAGRSARSAQGGLSGMAGALVGMSPATAAIGGGLAYAGKTFVDFEKAMSGVRANVEATPAQFAALTESVKKSGSQFGFSASESAAATEDLAKAGLDTAQIMGGGLTGALTLAAAGGISTANAAETAATAMTMFHKSASDVGQIADVLSNGANMSTASVDSLSQGLSQGGMQASQMGMSLEQTVGTLAMFDQAGLKGSDAGTSLKTMLMRLTPTSKEAAEAMDALGINAFDAGGNFVGMQALSDQLHKSLGGLSQEQRNAALATIFGSDAARAASVVMDSYSGTTQKGAKSVDEWVAAMSKQGTAAENARTRTDNLTGDLNKLRASVENAFIGFGQAASGPLREFVQILTMGMGAVSGIVGVLGSLPGPVSAAALALGAGALASRKFGDSLDIRGRVSSFTSGLSTLASTSRTVVTSADGMQRSLTGIPAKMAALGGQGSTLERMGVNFSTAAAQAERFPRAAGLASAGMTGLKGAAGGLMGAMGGPFGLAIAGAGIGLSMLADHQQKAAQAAAEHKDRVAELAGTLDQSTGAYTAQTRAVAAQQLEQQGLLSTAKKYGVSMSDMTDIYLGNDKVLQRVNASLDEQQKQYGINNTSIVAGGTEVARTDFKLRDFQKTLGKTAGSGKEAAESQKRVADATKQAGSAAAGAQSSQDKFAADQDKAAQSSAKMSEQLTKLHNTFLQLRGGERAVEASLDAVTKSIQENGTSLDIHTEKGRANAEAMDAVASSMQDNLAKMAQDGRGASEISSKYSEYRKQLYGIASQYHLTGAAADEYVAKALMLPDSVKTTVKLESEAATQALTNLKADAVSLNGQTITIAANSLPAEQMQAVLDGVQGARKNADGSISITADPSNVAAMRLALQDVKTAAVLANGTIVNIPATSNAGDIKKAIELLGAKSVSVNGTKVQINTSAPMANADRDKINKLKGAAVNANGTMVTIDSKAITADSLAKINQLLEAAHNKEIWITTYTQTIPVGVRNPNAAANAASNGVSPLTGMLRKASGGAISGPGTATSDSIPALLSNGEHVLDAQDVKNLGGQGAVYALRDMAARGWRVPGFAAGGAVEVRRFASGGSVDDDWTPDMSGIMAYANSLKVDPSALTEQRKKVADQNSALNKAIRDLKAARAGLSGKSGAARVKAENAVATAIERQAKAQRDLNDGKAKLNQMSVGAGADTTTRFMLGTTSQNGLSKRFLDNIERIRKRGLPRLARSLLEQGDSDAQAIAQTLSGGKLDRLKSAQAGLDTSDKLADRKAQMLDDLKGVSTAGMANQAQAQANAQLIAMRGAQAALAYTTGVREVQAPVDYDRLAQAVTRHLPAPIMGAPVTIQMDSREVGHGVMPHTMEAASIQARYGDLVPGMR